MKEFILLDWDGNLAMTLHVWLEACRLPLEKRGLYFSDEEIASCFGIPIERFAEWGIEDIDEAITEMDKEAARLLPEADLYPDAIFVLEELQQTGKKLALVTTSPRRKLTHLLDKYNLHDYFEVIVANEDTKRHKPDPEPLLLALSELGADKEAAVMIGDTSHDIGAAKNAGVDSILFYPDEHKKFYDFDELKKARPTHIVDDFRKILDLV